MPSSAPPSLRRTPLHGRHEAAGAKLVAFAGWEMPIQYPDGIRAEHLAVRERVGVFDVSHMGQIEVRGPQAPAFLQRMVSNDVRRLAVGGAQYGVLCREDGGVLDDLIAYRLAECEYLVVTNASRHDRDLAWLRERAADHDIDVIDAAAHFAMLAVQGPRAREAVGILADGKLPSRMHLAERDVAGRPALVCGTGYTGEDGVEILLAPGDAEAVWDALLDAGVEPVGLGARDTLRLEVCFPLYGNDLTEERGPIEAGLGWCCREQTEFIGAEAVAAVRAAGPAERLVAFAVEGGGIARAGNRVLGGGEVTSGTFSPSLGKGIGMAYVPADRAAAGTRIEIDVRGTVRTAVVNDKPLLRKDT